MTSKYFRLLFFIIIYLPISVFVYLPIYLAWMNFPVSPFGKIDNLSKICNLDNFYKNPKENWQVFLIYQVKSTRKCYDALKAFRNYSFSCFHWKITWHLGKVNKEVKSERVRNWIDAQSSCFGFTSFNVPSCLLPKTTNKLLLHNFYHFIWYSKNVCS